MNNELIYYLALSKIPRVGSVTAKNLISYCGGVEEVFKAKKKKLLSIPGIGDETAKEIIRHRQLHEAEKEIKFLEKTSIRVFSYLSADYPSRLKHFADSPLVLYYNGNADLNAKRIVSIVGTRKPTDYGKASCERLIDELKPYDIMVISGLAYGIDITAHRKCLDLSIPTIGVLGNGLDKVYPFVHKRVAEQMLQNGGLLSEFPIGTPPDREHFPMRNRIVAGMCDALVVVETKEKGGSMITANLANDYNKDVFAFPGRIHDPASKGCNMLIKSHRASLLEGAQDLIYIMRWNQAEKASAVQRSLFLALSNEEQQIADLLQSQKDMAIDQLTVALSKTPSEMAAILLNLEFQGVIRSLPGKRYALV